MRLEKPALAEVDGDILRETSHIRFTVERQALTVRVPEGTPSTQNDHDSGAAPGTDTPDDTTAAAVETDTPLSA